MFDAIKLQADQKDKKLFAAKAIKKNLGLYWLKRKIMCVHKWHSLLNWNQCFNSRNNLIISKSTENLKRKIFYN